jgi:DNA polymerase-3 subunit gamma/tau
MSEDRKELELKYRPLNFDELRGWSKEKESLISLIVTKRTYLLHGPRGCGKTTIGRLIAYKAGIDDVDIKEIDAATNTGVDDAREIKRNAGFMPLKGKNKIYIIDECHRLTGNALDALLKTLEEPPLHCYFVLCTTDLAKVQTTIQSRAAKYEVKPLTQSESKNLLDWICQEEKLNVSDPVKQAIIDQCERIPREMIVALDMVKAMTKDEDAIALILSSRGNAQIIDLCRLLIKKAAWSEIAAVLKQITDEPESVRYAVMGYMNAVLLNKPDKQAAMVIDWFSESFMYSKRPGLTVACFKATQ